MAPWLLSSDRLANTTPYALLGWAGLALMVVRIGRTGNCRWWLAQHGWATIAMTGSLNRENGGLAHFGSWVPQQLGIAALTLSGVLVIGLWCLSQSGRPLRRALAWAYGLLFVLFALTAGAKGWPYRCFRWAASAGPSPARARTHWRPSAGPSSSVPSMPYGHPCRPASAYLGQFFTHVRVAAMLSNPYGPHNKEWGGHVYICTGPRHPWGQIWPQLRHYD